MYAPPPSIDAKLFVGIPERFHVRGRKSAWIDVQLHGVSTPVFLEGPSFDQSGNLWLVDIPWGRLFKITPSGDVSCELEYDGWPNGLKFHKDGRAFITDAKNGIMVFCPKTQKIEPFIDKVVLTPFKGVNDLIFSSKGELFFTDQGQTGLHDPSGRLYRVGVDGKVECLLANIPSPNGLVLSPDENMVFLAVTRDNAIWRVPLLHGGGITKVGVFIQLSGGGGPDGLAMDEQGGIVVCHVGLGSVWLFDARGEPRLRIKSPTGYMTTNCAFGGPLNKQLFISENHSVLVAEMPVAGRRMYSHQ